MRADCKSSRELDERTVAPAQCTRNGIGGLDPSMPAEERMKQCRSAKVKRIIALRTRAAKLTAQYERGESRLAPVRHRARQCVEEARMLKGTLTPCEVTELRKAWSGV